MTAEQDRQPSQKLSPDLQAFEAVLASLQPTTGSLERDRLIFEAGKAAAETELAGPTRAAAQWLWPTVSAVMTTSAAFLLVALVWNSGPVAVKAPTNAERETPNQDIGEIARPTSPSGPKSIGDPNDQDDDAPIRTLASLLSGSHDARGVSSASYLHQREILLAFGGDGLPKFKTSPSAKSGHSNTRVSYMDLLDELTLESHGLAPSDSESNDFEP